MALSKSSITVHGFNAPLAYYRIEDVFITAKIQMKFVLNGYKDDKAIHSFEAIEFSCAYDIAGDNPIKQAYEHLKTLPEFAGAADV